MRRRVGYAMGQRHNGLPPKSSQAQCMDAECSNWVHERNGLRPVTDREAPPYYST